MLSVKDLAVSFQTRRGAVDAVRGISFDLAKGEILGIVGESGSGKSVTSYALMRILDQGGTIKAGEATYSGIDLRRAAERDMRDIRGREISMIFQNPRAALNPIRKVGHQIEDVLRQHARASRQDARAKAIAALKAVRINDAEARYRTGLWSASADRGRADNRAGYHHAKGGDGPCARPDPRTRDEQPVDHP